MKLQYNARKGRRIKRLGFFSVTPTNAPYWFCDSDNRWHHTDEVRADKTLWLDGRCTDYFGVKSVKAFIRKLKQWRKYLPKGTEFVLTSHWVGHSVKGRI